MDLEQFKKYCQEKPNTTWDFPFDQETLVFRIKKKIYALTNINQQPFSVNLKCDPHLARQLREAYPNIKPGYHMNKEHWNTITDDPALPQEKFFWLIDHSYDLVSGKTRSPKTQASNANPLDQRAF